MTWRAASQSPPRMPWLLALCVFVTFASSSLVRIEPAPCDCLFMITLVVALATGHAPIASGSGLVVMITGLVFLGVSSAAMVFAYDVGSTLRFQAITLYLFLAFGLVTSLLERYGVAFLRVAWAGLLVALLLSCVIALLAHYRLIANYKLFYLDDSGMRVRSTFKDPNVFGPFLAMAATVLCGEMLRNSRLGLARLALFLVSCYCLLLTFSRGSWINFVVGLTVFFGVVVLGLRSSTFVARLGRLGLVVCVLGVPVLVYLLLQTELLGYLQSRLSLQGYDSERFGSHARALDVATVEGLGIGPGQWVDTRFGIATHNLYLRVLTETGWLGLAAFLAFVGACLTAAVQGLRQHGPNAIWYAGAVAIIAGTLVESMVIDTLHWRHFFWFLALPVGLLAHETQHAPVHPPVEQRVTADAGQRSAIA